MSVDVTERVYVQHDGFNVVYFEIDDRKSDSHEIEWNSEKALAYLLLEEVVFVHGPVWGDGPETHVSVVANDIFAWGGSDVEPLPVSDIPIVLKAYVESPKWGVVRWCALHRGMRPQEPIVISMRREGAWDDELEALPAAPPS